MKLKLNIVSKRLLQHLFKSNEGLFIFTLYQRFKIPPSELFLAIKELESNKLIIEENDRLLLSSAGKEYVINNKLITKEHGAKPDNIPLKFLGQKLEINEFYLPVNFDFTDEALP